LVDERKPTSHNGRKMTQRIATRGNAKNAPIGEAAPPWVDSGPINQPFDFTAAMTGLIKDICRNVPEFSHIKPGQLLIGFTSARNNREAGLQARVTPLRFAGGQFIKQVRGRLFQVQQFNIHGVDMLYIMAFCLPRFLNQSFDEKCITIFHELYHIGPKFDGDLRRHHGRCAFHTSSKAKYDEQMAKLARTYLANGADPKLHGFLRLNTKQLGERHGRIVGVRAPRAKILPVTSELAEACRAT